MSDQEALRQEVAQLARRNDEMQRRAFGPSSQPKETPSDVRMNSYWPWHHRVLAAVSISLATLAVALFIAGIWAHGDNAHRLGGTGAIVLVCSIVTGMVLGCVRD
jgi:hypothetical protein